MAPIAGKHLVQGVAMGSAELVPGVSSGTVALVFGIYERLVSALTSATTAVARFAKLDRQGGRAALREVDGSFVFPLALGAVLAVAALSHLVNELLDEQPVEMAAVFFGMVAASAVVAWRDVERRDAVRAAAVAASAVTAFFVLGLRSAPLEDPALWQLWGGGAIAICALILPGVSGAFFLVMLGLYDSVLAVVVSVDLIALAVFASGCAVGLALFSRLLGWLLDRHHDTVLAALAGMMIGSLRVLWPWPDGVDAPALAAPPQDGWIVPLALAAVAAATVGALATFRRQDQGEPAQVG